jgi:hypothetical protein
MALVLRRKLGDLSGTVDVTGGLALVKTHQAPDQALNHVKEILIWIENNGTGGLEFPVQLCLICCRILFAAAEKDPHLQTNAHYALTLGYSLLQERAKHIQDETLRIQFLENVPFNREIQIVYQQA